MGAVGTMSHIISNTAFANGVLREMPFCAMNGISERIFDTLAPQEKTQLATNFTHGRLSQRIARQITKKPYGEVSRVRHFAIAYFISSKGQAKRVSIPEELLGGRRDKVELRFDTSNERLRTAYPDVCTLNSETMDLIVRAARLVLTEDSRAPALKDGETLNNLLQEYLSYSGIIGDKARVVIEQVIEFVQRGLAHTTA